MANKTIDQLTANAALAGTELLPLWQSSATVKLDVDELKEFVLTKSVYVESEAASITAAHAGNIIKLTAGFSQAFDIAAGAMSAGDVVTIISTIGTAATIVPGGGFSLYAAGNAVAGTRTIPGWGIATIYFTSSTEAFVAGVGVT